MRDSQKTRKQLISELSEARQQLEMLAAAEVERRQVGQELNQSEEKFYKAFLSSPDMVIITSTKDGKYIEANESFCRITGFSHDELIGHTTTDYNFFSNFQDQERMSTLLKKGAGFRNEEFSFRVRSGAIRIWLCSAEIINLNGEECLIAVATDITEMKKMEEALRKSEEKFSKAFRVSPAVLYITRLSDDTYVDINDTFSRVLGYTREEIIGHTSAELNIWVKPADWNNIMRQLTNLGRVSNEEVRFKTKAGETRTHLLSAEQIEFDGESCLLAVTLDITDYKRMEAQMHEAENLREVDRLRTELLANVSHELRTPLASIKGFATMLLDYDKRLSAGEKREYLETIDKNTDRLVELIEQLLEMSRLGIGMLSINKTPVDIISLCQTAIAEARVHWPDYNFVTETPPALPEIEIDDRRIRQVLDNILSNAVKYSSHGTNIKLTVDKVDSDIRFALADQGVGMSKTELHQLELQLSRAKRGEKTTLQSGGLGLSICKGLVEVHGGKIWIDSQEGKGTTCYFTLPINNPHAAKRVTDAVGKKPANLL